VGTEKYDVNDNPYLKFIEDRNDVDIEIINEASAQYNQKASTIFASGELPDYVLVTTTLRTNFSIWAKEGLLVPLDEYIKNTKYLKVDMMPLSWEVSKIDGKIFAIPMQRYDASPRMPFARKAWMEKLGRSPADVKTIDDWRNLLRDFTEKDPDGNGKKDTFGMTGTDTVTDEFPLYIFLDSFGAAKSKIVEGKVLPNYVLPEYREWLKFMNGLYKAGILDPEYLVNTKEQYWEKIVSGRIGAFYHFWSLQEYNGLKGKREDLVAMRPPAHRDGSAAGNINVMPVRHWIAVTKKAKNPGKIVSLMDWVFSDEGGTFVHAGASVPRPGRLRPAGPARRVPGQGHHRHDQHRHGMGFLRGQVEEVRRRRVDQAVYGLVQFQEIGMDAARSSGRRHFSNRKHGGSWKTKSCFFATDSRGCPLGCSPPTWAPRRNTISAPRPPQGTAGGWPVSFTTVPRRPGRSRSATAGAS